MGELPMPGGWTLSGMWMPMCGQGWADAAAAFAGMWALMMPAMMLPAVAPSLWRAARRTPPRAAWAATGYFGVWVLPGLAVFAVGAVWAQAALAVRAISEAVPLLTAAVLVAAGCFQRSAWKERRLACCREGFARLQAAAPRQALREGLRLGWHCMQSCAGLTAMLLATGMMDALPAALATAAVAAERLAPAGAHVARGVGTLAIGTGLVLAARAAW